MWITDGADMEIEINDLAELTREQAALINMHSVVP